MKKYRWNKKKFINNMIKLVLIVGAILIINHLNELDFNSFGYYR